eukprot:sb/3476346/
MRHFSPLHTYYAMAFDIVGSRLRFPEGGRFYLRVGILFWLSFGSHAFVSRPIWSNQSFRTLKIMLFPVISGFLPKSESKWGLSRANTTPCDKRGVTTSKNPTLLGAVTIWVVGGLFTY